ncbi:MAG TPA: polyprenol phosphomannose-dependent alpha 1,6 mannosyltransferase MptB [Solirubrobacteraceae bacterium]|nr:polyprenol phosphomannose-dependent alpha 1,6 mannosyltransferase MptB [Solirubrobacteraceae bacterium]
MDGAVGAGARPALAADARPASVRPRSGVPTRAWRAPLAVVCGLVMVAAAVEIVLDASLLHSPLAPKSPRIAAWMASLGGERLGYRTFLIAIFAFAVAYGVLIWLARRPLAPGAEGEGAVRPREGALALAGGERRRFRWALALVLALELIVFVGPILISTDVFSYIAYARMGVVHGINPYLHGPDAISGDPVFRYVGQDWLKVETAYGPLYTLLSYPLGLLGVVGALWGMKVYALLASLGTLALTWQVARRLALDPVFALLAVGANPLYVIYGLGGAHNDLIMLALMTGAVALTLADRDALAGAAVVAGALVKATVAVLLPFMVLARRRSAAVYGALAALALGALVAYLAFGVHGVNIVSALNRDSAFVSTDSFPTELAHLAGKPGVFPADHDLLKAALVLIVLHLLWRTWRGYDWVAASGWALLAISVTSTWLLAWYILWPLPLAVMTRDRRLLWATLFVQALFLVHQTSPLFAPVQ